MNVVVTGTGGRLGAAVARHLRERHSVVAYDRKAMDLREPEVIADHLRGTRFDVLINCAALTSLEYCERHPDEAAQVNEHAAALMARLCRESGARMIQISTNYVYDGKHRGLRAEEDPVRPLSVYAKTKLAGELNVLGSDDKNIAARTAWIFGPDRESFVDQIIARARKEGQCSAICDVWSSASYSIDMADQIERLMMNPQARGTYNLSNDGTCSWRELGQVALECVAALGWKLRCDTLEGRSVAGMPSFVAARPVNTAMDISRLACTTGLRPRSWQAALRDYLGTYYSR